MMVCFTNCPVQLWNCVVQHHDVEWYFMALSCIDIVEVILSDWHDTGAGMTEKWGWPRVTWPPDKAIKKVEFTKQIFLQMLIVMNARQGRVGRGAVRGCGGLWGGFGGLSERVSSSYRVEDAWCARLLLAVCLGILYKIQFVSCIYLVYTICILYPIFVALNPVFYLRRQDAQLHCKWTTFLITHHQPCYISRWTHQQKFYFRRFTVDHTSPKFVYIAPIAHLSGNIAKHWSCAQTQCHTPDLTNDKI